MTEMSECATLCLVSAWETGVPTNNDNRRRAFSDVVTIDAWHDAFGDGTARVELHADVVFDEARVGGEQASPVRFRLRIRCAEVVVVVPEHEPVEVDKASVSRDTPSIDGTLLTSEVTKLAATGRASVVAAPGAVVGLVAGGLRASKDVTLCKDVRAPLDLFSIIQSQTADGEYRWVLKPAEQAFLSGRPWDATERPRLTLIDRRKDKSAPLPPSVRVEVRCLREDLEIDDFQVKDEGAWERMRRTVGFKNRLAAAESYIRDQLMKEGLEVENISDPFGRLTLASVVAHQQVEED